MNLQSSLLWIKYYFSQIFPVRTINFPKRCFLYPVFLWCTRFFAYQFYNALWKQAFEEPHFRYSWAAFTNPTCHVCIMCATPGCRHCGWWPSGIHSSRVQSPSQRGVTTWLRFSLWAISGSLLAEAVRQLRLLWIKKDRFICQDPWPCLSFPKAGDAALALLWGAALLQLQL